MNDNLKTMAGFQDHIGVWMRDVFGDVIAMDPLERIIRFLEEALELAQAQGLTVDEVNRVVKYVYNREKGEVPQEVAGVVVTLSAFCYRMGIDMEAESVKEFYRIDSPEMRKKIFDKQKYKRKKGLTSDSSFRSK